MFHLIDNAKIFISTGYQSDQVSISDSQALVTMQLVVGGVFCVWLCMGFLFVLRFFDSLMTSAVNDCFKRFALFCT